MKKLKSLSATLLLSALFSLCSSAQIRVVCVGNSITEGVGASDAAHNYPSQLANLLGSNYVVYNCGISARTMLKKGDIPYMNEQKFTDAKNYNPDILIISLGTNDSKYFNWVHKADFFTDYKYMINQFRLNGRNPHIFVCAPSPAFIDNYAISNSVIHDEIIPLVDSLRNTLCTSKIDYYHNLLSAGSTFPDGIHPNDAGALLMAKIAYNAITKPLKITSVQSPVSKYLLSNNEQITVTINNNKSTALINLPIAYKVDNQTEIKEIISSIPANSEVTYRFTHKVDLSQLKEYAISVYTAINADPTNDTINTKVVNFRSSADLAMRFFGNNGKVVVPHSPSLMPTDALTVDAWVYPTAFKATAAEGTIVSKEQIATDKGYALSVGGNGQARFLICDGLQRATTSPIGTLVLNKWQHIAGVYSGTKLQLYVDGVLKSTNGCQKIQASTSDFVIGQTAIKGLDRAFVGGIDEVRVWNKALSSTEINDLKGIQLWGDEPGLVGYYKMNEGFGSNFIVDSTATDKNGQIQALDADQIWMAGAGLAPKIGTAPNDIALVGILSPKTQMGLTNNESVSVRIFNFSNSTLNNVPISYRIGSNSAITEAITSIPAQSSFEYTFSQKADFSEAKEYTITAYTSLNGDINAGNNLATKTITNFSPNSDNAILLPGGTVGCINIPHSSSIMPSAAFTIQAWIYPTQFRANYYEGSVISKESSNGGYALNVGGDGQARIVIGANNWYEAVVPAKTISLNKWTHIAGVYDGSTVKIYINGVLKATTSTTGALKINSTPLYIGASPEFSSREFIGGIDEVSIWNKALTASEINSLKDYLLQGNENGLTAYYHLNEGPGSLVAIDVSANKNNGTIQNIDIEKSWMLGVGLRLKVPSALSLVNSLSDIVVYPSISNDFVYVKLPNEKTKTKLVITDIQGRTVTSKEIVNNSSDFKVDVHNFTKGIYFFTFNRLSNRKTVKITIN